MTESSSDEPRNSGGQKDTAAVSEWGSASTRSAKAGPTSDTGSLGKSGDPDLQARLDTLTTRNAKLLETLKEARQQLIALREEVDRLGQPPSGYGVLLAVFEDLTVDVFTSGRKMRLTVSPNIDVDTLKRGQSVRLNEALTIVEAGDFDSVGEISTLREVLDDGHRALVVGHADEERVVWLAEPLSEAISRRDRGQPQASSR